MNTNQTPYPTQKNSYIKNIYILFLSIMIVWLSTRIPVTVYRQGELSPISFGYPFQFVHQYQTYTPPFPWKTSFSTPMEHPTQIQWETLLIDIGIVYIMIWFIWRVVKNKYEK